MSIDNIPHVITAACVLHNICETHHEHFNDAWLQTEGEYTQPDSVASGDTATGLPQDIRNALVQYFQNNLQMAQGTQCLHAIGNYMRKAPFHINMYLA